MFCALYKIDFYFETFLYISETNSVKLFTQTMSNSNNYSISTLPLEV